MPPVQKRSVPAYDGARFDVDGFCTAHADVRLSKLSDGKYKTVRKTCCKCGSATLARHMTSRGTRRMTVSARDIPSEAVQSRGTRRKTTSCRVVPSEVLIATGDGKRLGAGCPAKNIERRPPVKAERRSGQDLAARTKRSPPPDRKGGSRSPPASQNRRSAVSEIANKKVTGEKVQKGRHLVPTPKISAKHVPSVNIGQSSGAKPSKNNKRSQNPRRKEGGRRIRRHSISLFSTSSSTSQNRRSSMSEMEKKKVTNEKIKELMSLMQPPAASARDRPSGGGVPFDESGYCRAHPEVRLAKRKPEGGGWEVVSGVCPRCCVGAVMACRQTQPSAENDAPHPSEKGRPHDARGLIGTVLTTRSGDAHEHGLAAGSSSRPRTPEPLPKPAFSAEYWASSDLDVVGPALGSRTGRAAGVAQAPRHSCVRHRDRAQN